MGFPVRHGSARPNLWWSHGIAPLQTDRLFQDPSCMPSSRCLVLLTEICMTIQTEIEQRRKKKPTYNALRRKSYAIPSLFINWSITTALRSEVGSCCKLFIQWQRSFWMKSAPPLVKLLATETDHCHNTATRHCRNLFSQWQGNFQWKLHSHWLKVLRQCHVAVTK